MTSRPHNARTNALRNPAASGYYSLLSGTPDLRFCSIAASVQPARHGTDDSANAVWVRAHPGFKSPSLRP